MTHSSNGLALLDRASQLLSRATSLEDVKEVRDAAEAARTFAKAARLGLELQNRAAELKLRAERKAGAFLAELKLRGGDRRSKGRPVTLKLDDLGVTKRQSELWQLAASVPDSDFEQYVRGRSQLGKEVTASGLLLIAKTLRRRAPSKRQLRPGGRYATHNGRAKLLCMVEELKAQCCHLSNLLQPLTIDGEIVYKQAERRFIRRLAQDIEQAIEELQQLLWKSG